MQNNGIGIVASPSTHSSKDTRRDFERFYREKKLEEKAKTEGLTKAEKAELAYIKTLNILDNITPPKDTFNRQKGNI